MSDDLSLWTIYDHPLDHLDSWVVRRWAVGPDGAVPAESYCCETLEDARKCVPPDLWNLGRQPEDDPLIVETWV